MGHHGNSFLSFGAAGGVGGWVNLGRTILGSTNATVDVTGLANKRYLQFIWRTIDKPSARETRMRVGNGSFDSDTNYSTRRSVNGGSDNTNVSETGFRINNNALNEDDWGVGYISNFAGNEKLSISWMGETLVAASNIPSRQETVDKWDNTSVSIDQLQLLLNGSGSFGVGTELIINGWDPADTHTTNFWELLHTATLSSDDSTFDSGVFDSTAKYLWIQVWYKGTGSTSVGNTFMRVGNSTVDLDSNYASRGSTNGIADVTSSSQTSMVVHDDAGSDNIGFFNNMYILNDSATEKLIIGNSIQGNAVGAGSLPTRFDYTNKWANTSVQLDRLELLPQAGSPDIASGAIMNIYGSD